MVRVPGHIGGVELGDLDAVSALDTERLTGCLEEDEPTGVNNQHWHETTTTGAIFRAIFRVLRTELSAHLTGCCEDLTKLPGLAHSSCCYYYDD